jgi:hypothetical protein
MSVLLFGFSLATAPPARAAGNVAELTVDCSQVVGEIRPLHGVNCGPLDQGEMVDLSAFHRELALPYTRLHDCHWPNPDVVDIHAVFPNFAADPAQPSSYDFRRTDAYLQAILATGSRLVYRLGESIEHTRTKYRVHPPADPAKWAAIALGIIRHYNEGWAGGHRYDIRYWEIWNEPENRPAMWTGTDEDYFRLYGAAAGAIKERFPHLKVGGPSLGDTGRVKEGRFEPSAFFVRFLEFCRAQAVPLDFFSWHLYADDPSACVARARGVRDTLDRHGFARTESHFNEWNYLPGNDWTPMMLQGQGRAREKFYQQMGGAPGAAFAAAVLLFLQDSPVDVANFYRADTGGFGLFTCDAVPKKVFHAFRAFRLLLDTPVRLAAGGAQPGRLAICAGTNRDRSELHILVSNFRSDATRLETRVAKLPWDGPTRCETFLLDEVHDLTRARETTLTGSSLTLSEDLKAPALCLFKLNKPTTAR